MIYDVIMVQRLTQVQAMMQLTCCWQYIKSFLIYGVPSQTVTSIINCSPLPPSLLPTQHIYIREEDTSSSYNHQLTALEFTFLEGGGIH